MSPWYAWSTHCASFVSKKMLVASRIVAVSHANFNPGDSILKCFNLNEQNTGGRRATRLWLKKSSFKYKHHGYYPVHMSLFIIIWGLYVDSTMYFFPLSSNFILEQDWLNHIATNIVSQAVQCVEVAFNEEGEKVIRSRIFDVCVSFSPSSARRKLFGYKHYFINGYFNGMIYHVVYI